MSAPQDQPLLQTVHTLNQELRRAAASSLYVTSKCCWTAFRTLFSAYRYTLDDVSQLDQDFSTAVAAIREWRNSLLSINRLPPEVLSLIPNHLPHEVDLIHLCSVCRYWRKTFTQCATLWSKLTLTLGVSDLCITTWLQCARNCPLDILSTGSESAETLALLHSRAQRFQNLCLIHNSWSDVQRFSVIASGPLPLLQSLTIHVTGFDPLDPEISSCPHYPLFTNAMRMTRFILCAEGLPYLDYFAFTSLRTFELSVTPEGTFADEKAFPVHQLLDFLEATPTLEILTLAIYTETSLDRIPQGRKAVLPNVKHYHVTELDPSYTIAMHISCSSAHHTSFVCEQNAEDPTPQDAFSATTTWHAVPPQNMAAHVDAIILELTAVEDVTCFVSFVSSGPTTFQLGYKIVTEEGYSDTPWRSLQIEYAEVISQASKLIRNHPFLANIRRVHIRDRHSHLCPHLLPHITNHIGQLFSSLGPLDDLVLETSDLEPYLAPFLNIPDGTSSVFTCPQILVLTIVDNPQQCLNGDSEAGIVGFAKAQHSLGIPFEQVVLQLNNNSVKMAERLQTWVGSVRFQ